MKILTLLEECFRNIWNGLEAFPPSWREAKVVVLFKGKGSRKDPNNYRGIFLLDVGGKILARIIANRITPITEAILDEWQYGFRPGRGTQLAISILRKLQEEARYKNINMYVIFIDLEKAFDSVPRESLWSCLKRLGIRGRMLEIIKAFHEGFEGSIGDETFNMDKGVRQGCVLGPLLFNIVFDTVVKRAILNGLSGGVMMKHEDGSFLEINRLAYADDLCLIDTEWNNLINNLNILNASFLDLGLKINIGKTKVLNLNGDTRILTAGHQLEAGIEWVSSFCYLGSTISSAGNLDAEVKERIKKGTQKIRDLRPVLKSSKLSMRNKKKVINACIFSVVYYGCESWRTADKNIKKLHALHNLCTRIVRKKHKIEKIRMDILDIGLPHPMDIIASKRLTFHSKTETSEEYETIKRIWKGEIQMGKKISGRKKQSISECLRVDIQWLFGDDAVYGDFINRIIHRDPTVSRETYINSLIRSGRLNRTRTTVPKLINERDKRHQCPVERCYKEFAEKKELNRHMKRDHAVSASANPDQLNETQQQQLPFPCTLCKKSYKTKGWLKRHLYRDHKLEETEEIGEPTMTPAQTSTTNTTEERVVENLNIPGNQIQSVTDPPTISTAVEEAIGTEETHLTFRIADLTARGEFRCPFRGCTKSTNTAKGMQNHGYTTHGWSFLTGKPKRSRRPKLSDPVGGLSGGC